MYNIYKKNCIQRFRYFYTDFCILTGDNLFNSFSSIDLILFYPEPWWETCLSDGQNFDLANQIDYKNYLQSHLGSNLINHARVANPSSSLDYPFCQIKLALSGKRTARYCPGQHRDLLSDVPDSYESKVVPLVCICVFQNLRNRCYFDTWQALTYKLQSESANTVMLYSSNLLIYPRMLFIYTVAQMFLYTVCTTFPFHCTIFKIHTKSTESFWKTQMSHEN